MERARGRSLADFGGPSGLSEAEQLLLTACQSGAVAEIGPSRPSAKEERITVRADFLRFLALGGDDDSPVHEHGVRLKGAWVKGDLDFVNCELPVAFECEASYLDGVVLLRDARVQRGVSLDGCSIGGLQGQRVRVEGDVRLGASGGDRFESSGEIDMDEARIGGSLRCEGGKLEATQGAALSCVGAEVAGSVFLRALDQATRFETKGAVCLLGVKIGGVLSCEGGKFEATTGAALRCDCADVAGDVLLCAQDNETRFEAKGAVWLLGAKIGGNLVCSGGKFEVVMGAALSCDRVEVAGSVFLDVLSMETRFEAKGDVRLLGAKIGSDLACIGGKFAATTGYALSCDCADIAGSVFLGALGKETRFESKGEVRLSYAKIGGVLGCDGGKFEATTGFALRCECADVAGGVFLRAQDNETCFEAKGKVQLLGIKVGGNLECSGGKFETTNVNALILDNAEVAGCVFLRARDQETRFEAKGAVRLSGARIGSYLDCSGGKFEATSDDALRCDLAEVAGSVFLGALGKEPRFEAKGEVRLLGAKIGGNLECVGGKFEANNDADAIQATGLRVTGALRLLDLAAPCHRVVLLSAAVGWLDDRLESWGMGLVLDGFEYGRLAGGSFTTANERLAWLNKQVPEHSANQGNGNDFRPQPWRQLQSVLRNMGHFEDAREVAIAFEDRLRDADRIGQPPQGLRRSLARPYRFIARSFHLAFKWLTGYGQRPLRLLGWMLGVWAVCALWYWFAASRLAVFGPTDPLVFQNPAYVVEVPESSLSAPETEESERVEVTTRRLLAGGNWYSFSGLPEEYTAFSPIAYSLDVILPLVDLQQERDWAPLIPTPKAGFIEELFHFDASWKHATRLLMWLETLFGWVVSLLLVAIVSGLTRRREE